MTSAHDQSAKDTAASAQPDATAGGQQPGSAPPEGAARQYVPRQAARHDDAGGAGRGPAGAALGLTIAAAVMMMVSGVWNFLEGLAAVVRGGFFIRLPTYAYDLSVRGWGWFHLILGVVVFLAGAGLLTDKLWARTVGVTLAALSAVVNFLYIPYLPVWSVVVIAIDLAIIWALLTPRRGYA